MSVCLFEETHLLMFLPSSNSLLDGFGQPIDFKAHFRVNLNATTVGSISARGNELFNIFIASLW